METHIGELREFCHIDGVSSCGFGEVVKMQRHCGSGFLELSKRLANPLVRRPVALVASI